MTIKYEIHAETDHSQSPKDVNSETSSVPIKFSEL